MSRPSKQQELDRIDSEMKGLQDQMSNLTVDESRKAKTREEEPQTLMSRKDMAAAGAPVIKPTKSFAPNGKAIPGLEAEHKKAWELITVIFENKEVIGEQLEFWLKLYPQDPCYFWQIPANRPVQVPFHVADHIFKQCKYTVYKMQDRDPRALGHGDFAQTMVIEETRRRLDCRPVGFGM